MATYAQQFTTLLQLELGERFTVTDHQGLIVATHSDGATLALHLPNVDKRHGVHPSDIARWIEYSAAKLRSSLPHFTELARAQARELLADVSVS